MPKLATHTDLPDQGSCDREFDNIYRSIPASQNVLPLYGDGAPSTTPNYIGQTYLDTTAKREYRAYGTSSSADWRSDGTWESWTPTISAGTGTITTVTATGKYSITGKILHYVIIITITNNGTGGSYVSFTLPSGYTVPYDSQVAVGSGSSSADRGLYVFTSANSGIFLIRKYDGTYPGASGVILSCSGMCEIN